MYCFKMDELGANKVDMNLLPEQFKNPSKNCGNNLLIETFALRCLELCTVAFCGLVVTATAKKREEFAMRPWLCHSALRSSSIRA